MKNSLLECLTKSGRLSREDKELQRRAIRCLCKANDEIFDDANRLSNSTDPEEIVDAVRRAYEDRYKMVLW